MPESPAIVEEIKEEEKQFDQPVFFDNPPLPEAKVAQPRVRDRKKRKNHTGRPVRGLPFDQFDYLDPLAARGLFRKLVKIFKNPKSATWAKLALVLNQDELEWLRRYFSDSKCRYSYAKDGSRREIGE